MSKNYYRVESPTQTAETAVKQAKTKQIWGKAARGSNILAVKAYRGNLTEGERGVDFTTAIQPHPGSGSPFEAKWYYPHTVGTFSIDRDDVEYAAIEAESVVNRQI